MTTLTLSILAVLFGLTTLGETIFILYNWIVKRRAKNKLRNSLEAQLRAEVERGAADAMQAYAAMVKRNDEYHEQVERYRATMHAIRVRIVEDEQHVKQQALALMENEMLVRQQTLEMEMKERRAAADKECVELAERVTARTIEAESAIAMLTQTLNNWSALERAAALERANRETDAQCNHLVLGDEALNELAELYEAIRGLHVMNPVPLYKAVFEMYLRVPFKELVKRTDAEQDGGIYKITDLIDGRIYIGKTVNFANRWLEHIKRGCGYESGTVGGNLLYGQMMKHGVWNFSFSKIEIVADEDMRSEREKYWIEYFDSANTGLNLRRG